MSQQRATSPQLSLARKHTTHPDRRASNGLFLICFCLDDLGNSNPCVLEKPMCCRAACPLVFNAKLLTRYKRASSPPCHIQLDIIGRSSRQSIKSEERQPWLTMASRPITQLASRDPTIRVRRPSAVLVRNILQVRKRLIQHT